MYTVKELLQAMKLPEYSHVVVKFRKPRYGLSSLGGGSPESVTTRFGERVVDWSYIIDGVYHIVVKEL